MSYTAGDVVGFVDDCARDVTQCAEEVVSYVADEYLDDLLELALEKGLPALYDGLVAAGLPDEAAWALTAAVDLGATYASEELLEELGLDRARAAFGVSSGPSVGGFEYGPGTELWEPTGGQSQIPNPYAEAAAPWYGAAMPIFRLGAALRDVVTRDNVWGELRAHHREAAARFLAWVHTQLSSGPIGQAFGPGSASLSGVGGTDWELIGFPAFVNLWDNASQWGYFAPAGKGYGGVAMLPHPVELAAERTTIAAADAAAPGRVGEYSNGPFGSDTLWQAIEQTSGTAVADAARKVGEELPGVRAELDKDAEWSKSKIDVPTSLENLRQWRAAGRPGAFTSSGVTPSAWASARSAVSGSVGEKRRGGVLPVAAGAGLLWALTRVL